MQLIPTVLSLSLLPFTTASSTCSSSGALSWPPVGDCSATHETAVQNCRACCIADADCFQVCAKAAGIGKRDTIGEQFSVAIMEKRELKSRAIALSCDSNEGCYKFTDGSLLCLNLGTGNYHDDVGGHGDYYTGEYTGSDGTVQTGTSSATATDGTKASSIRSWRTRSSTAPVQTTSTGATRIASITGALASSTAASATSAVSTGGSDVLYVGTNIGLIGLIVRLIL